MIISLNLKMTKYYTIEILSLLYMASLNFKHLDQWIGLSNTAFYILNGQ